MKDVDRVVNVSPHGWKTVAVSTLDGADVGRLYVKL
jgi:hypothetical protein